MKSLKQNHNLNNGFLGLVLWVRLALPIGQGFCQK